MPFDLDRIIDRAGYLATQQCIQPYAQQRRVSSAPLTTSASAAAAAGTARTAGARKSSLGSLVSPWSTSSGGGSNSSSRRSPALYYHRPRPPAQQGYSPVDLFFTAPVGIPVRGAGGAPARPTREDSSSSLDQFVTAPVGDFNNTGNAPAASAADLLVPPLQGRGNGSRPGSSDTDDDWTFATASGGSGGTGTFSGLDTTVDLTPSPPPPSAWTGKAARHTVAPRHLRQQPQPTEQDPGPGPGHDRVSAVTLQVPDLRRTKRFYERVFGAAPCLPSSDHDEEDGTSARLRLNGGGVVVTLRESPPDARRGHGAGCAGVLLTVPVDDVGEVCRRLRSLAEEEGEEMKGWGSVEPVNGPGGARVVTFSDPAGHCWQVVQGLEGP